MRHALAVLASIGLGLGTIALAAPAQGVTTVTVTVTDGSNPGTFALSPSSATATSITIDNQTTVGDIRITSSSLFGGGGGCEFGCVVTTDPPLTFDISSLTPANTQVNISDASDSDRSVLLLVTYTSGGGGGDDSGSMDASGPSPASEMQQFGLPASGNCEDGATEAMNWSGIPSGGWGISWAQWMNDGAGGAVCTRTVMYDTSTAKWTVN